MFAHRTKDLVITFDGETRQVFHLESKKHCEELKDKVGIAFETIIMNPGKTVDCNTLGEIFFKI